MPPSAAAALRSAPACAQLLGVCIGIHEGYISEWYIPSLLYDLESWASYAALPVKLS